MESLSERRFGAVPWSRYRGPSLSRPQARRHEPPIRSGLFYWAGFARHRPQDWKMLRRYTHL